jgi:predicted esterase
MYRRWIAFLTLLFGFILSPAYAEEKNTDKQSTDLDSGYIDPSTIDPVAEGATDFLDVNISQYAKTAYEAYEEGEYEKSAQYYLALLRYDVTQAVAIYNLACCYGLMGEVELAADNLQRAFRAGYRDIKHILKDPDFDNVKDDPRFSVVLDSLTLLIEENYVIPSDVIYNKATIQSQCLIQLPSDFDSTKSYPLVVGLHGWGSNAEGFLRLWKVFDEPEFIFAIPQAPYAFGVGTQIGYSWEEWIPNEEELTIQARQSSEDYVMQVVQTLKENQKVDNVFLMGFSQGGSLAYSVGIKNHEAFDGIIPLGGWLDEDWLDSQTLAGAKDLPVFIGHGKNDNKVAFKKAKDAKKVLEKLGYDVTFYTFKGGHSVPEEEAEAMILWIEGH